MFSYFLLINYSSFHGSKLETQKNYPNSKNSCLPAFLINNSSFHGSKLEKQKNYPNSKNSCLLAFLIHHSSFHGLKIRNAQRIMMSFSNGEADLAWT
jgi:hypothetical protein